MIFKDEWNLNFDGFLAFEIGAGRDRIPVKALGVPPKHKDFELEFPLKNFQSELKWI